MIIGKKGSAVNKDISNKLEWVELEQYNNDSSEAAAYLIGDPADETQDKCIINTGRFKGENYNNLSTFVIVEYRITFENIGVETTSNIEIERDISSCNYNGTSNFNTIFLASSVTIPEGINKLSGEVGYNVLNGDNHRRLRAQVKSGFPSYKFEFKVFWDK